MIKSILKKYSSLLLVVSCFTVEAQESKLQPTIAQHFDIGGFKLYLECYENNKPMLILEQGFGLSGSDGVWLKNIEKLQSEYSVCLYDRSGLGKSEQGPIPFTVNDMATRLKKLLETADIKGPYYLAGGSYASHILRAYNHLYSQDVLGAVLIDPPALGYFKTMASRWPENFQTDNEQLKRLYEFEQTVKDPLFKRVPEKVDHLKSYQQLVNSSNFGDKPVITIRSKQVDEPYDAPFVPREIASVMDEFMAGAEAYFKGLSTNSAVIYSQSDKHHLHIADPELVVKSILDLKQMKNKDTE